MPSLKNKILLFLLMVCGFIITSCQPDRNEIMALDKKVAMPALTGKGVTMLYSDSAVLKMKLQTPQMQQYEKNVKEPVTIMPKGLFIIFYDEKGKEATTLKADYGVLYKTSNRMEVKYNVEVVNVNGEKFDEQVESDNPPTVAQLAEQGTKKEVPLYEKLGMTKIAFQSGMHFNGALGSYLKRISEFDPQDVIDGLLPEEREAVRRNIKLAENYHLKLKAKL